MAKPIFTFRKRAFLNHITTGHTSFIVAEVESSADGAYRFGNYMLTIADCNRIVRLEFPIGSRSSRRESLAKINLLQDIVTSFRDALAKEIEALDNFKEVK
jgi:hypothetical protein